MNEKSEVAAIPWMKHAIELDPNFAMAYATMGIMYSNIGEASPASQYSQKAYDLRDRVSERERFRITGNYYGNVTGELEKAASGLRVVGADLSAGLTSPWLPGTPSRSGGTIRKGGDRRRTRSRPPESKLRG